MEIILALITAVSFGIDYFLIRKGLIKTPYPIVAAFITLSINFSFFIVLSFLFIPLHFLKPEHVYFFIIAGVLAPGCARVLSYKGLETLGMTINTPIINAESLFSVVMALIFLNEPMNWSMLTGILGVVCGLVLLGHETGQEKGLHVLKRFRYRYLVYPMMASIFYGVSVFFRKLGLNVLNSPILGAAFTSGTSWCILAIILKASGNDRKLLQIKKESLVYFLVGGGVTCVAWLSLFHALSMGRIVIVTPIAASYSFVTLLLSYLLLREVERFSLKIGIATVLIVGGIALLSLTKRIASMFGKGLLDPVTFFSIG